tara:strand:+ start:316 stop:975 length:660 start_codon:yes stop_codon:yes gene_type:complete
MKKHWKKLHHHGKRVWFLFWHQDSAASWIANIVVAFLIIYFIFYPALGSVLGTEFPIVAVVSGSMEHGIRGDLCGQEFDEFYESFDNYWRICGSWYENIGISKEQFEAFPFKDGFNTGDMLILWRADRNNLEVGDILVFQAHKAQPIIHRVIRIWEEDGERFYQTKGDHNARSITQSLNEDKISEDRVYGKGAIRIPYFGWVKILFVDLVRPFGIEIER